MEKTEIPIIHWEVTTHRTLKGKWYAEVGDLAKMFDSEEDAMRWVNSAITNTKGAFEKAFDEWEEFETNASGS